ncbi:MAG TPA: TIM-barrel domain-containing protein, partial [Verrucomicrobiae bacterium]
MKTWLLPWLLVCVATGAPIQFQGTPRELVVSKVSERTVRIELLNIGSDGKTEATRATSAFVPFKTDELLRVRDLTGNRELAAPTFRVQLSSSPLRVAVHRGDGSAIQELSFTETNFLFRVNAPLLGLGEGAQQFDRRGAKYPMEPSWGGWNRAQLGSVVPSPFLIGTDGLALFVDTPEGEFDLRESLAKFNPRTKGGLDLFVIDVREPSDAVTEYTRLTGRPVMPPKWTLGYMQSHRTLAGPDEVLQIARTFREKKLPCDALIYLGTGYCTNGWNTGHGSVKFNPNAFDRPEEMIRTLHDENFKIILHVNHAPRDLFGLSFGEQSESPRHIRNYWNRHRETFALGVDGWWPDDGDELPLEARLARHRCYFEGALQDRPNVRPWSLHRTGYAGAQRYGGWIWSGDIDGSWATLASQVSVGLNHSLSLTPFWGTDTGGFYPARELTGELYARWFEFSAFCPLFRSHGRTWHLRLPWGWNTGEPGPLEHATGPDASELHNAQVEPICRKYLELRYRMLPYNYSLAREACDTGMPMMRALWLHYANDPQVVKLGDEYLWGRDVLV